MKQISNGDHALAIRLLKVLSEYDRADSLKVSEAKRLAKRLVKKLEKK